MKTCKHEGCNSSVLANSDLCSVHFLKKAVESGKCAFDGCDAKSKPSSSYCERHACLADGCDKQAIPGKMFCSEHQFPTLDLSSNNIPDIKEIPTIVFEPPEKDKN